MTLDTVLKEALSLHPRERSIVADELWRSLPFDESELALTPTQARDLEKRIAEDAAGESDPQDWEKAREELRRRS